MNQINVAIDLHGTYDVRPDEFDHVMRELIQKHGIQFWIFSGSPVSDIKFYFRRRAKLVRSLNSDSQLNSFDFDFIHPKLKYLSIVDFCFKQNLSMIEKTNIRTGKPSWYFDGDEQIWWAMKAIICQQNNIHLLFDDKKIYQNYFGPTHPTLFFPVENNFTSVELFYTTINFYHHSPEFVRIKANEIRYQDLMELRKANNPE